MTLFWGAVVFTIGGAIQTVTNGFVLMLIGRIISGFGVGLLSCVLLIIYRIEVLLRRNLAELSFLYTKVKSHLPIM